MKKFQPPPLPSDNLGKAIQQVYRHLNEITRAVPTETKTVIINNTATASGGGGVPTPVTELPDYSDTPDTYILQVNTVEGVKTLQWVAPF